MYIQKEYNISTQVRKPPIVVAAIFMLKVKVSFMQGSMKLQQQQLNIKIY